MPDQPEAPVQQLITGAAPDDEVPQAMDLSRVVWMRRAVKTPDGRINHDLIACCPDDKKFYKVVLDLDAVEMPAEEAATVEAELARKGAETVRRMQLMGAPGIPPQSSPIFRP